MIHGPSKAEELLEEAMRDIGLDPEPQYDFPNENIFMTVDFAFPKQKLVVEVDGPHHKEEFQKDADKKRDYILRKNDWQIKRYSASAVHNDPKRVAKRVQNTLNNIERVKIHINSKKKDVVSHEASTRDYTSRYTPSYNPSYSGKKIQEREDSSTKKIITGLVIAGVIVGLYYLIRAITRWVQANSDIIVPLFLVIMVYAIVIGAGLAGRKR